MEILKIDPGHITVYDCTRSIPDSYRDRIKYPVKFIEQYGSTLMRRILHKATGNLLTRADMKYEIPMTHDIRDEKGNKIRCYLPRVLTSSDHIINVPIFKSHQFVLASGALKNHYGTVRFSGTVRSPKYLHPPVIHESIADINNHPVIRNRTRLVVMDALFGRVKKKGGSPDKWTIFNNNNPHRLFLSKDPVALDSVTSYFIKEELKKRNEELLSDKYLEIASHRGIGVHERPVNARYKLIDFKHIDI